MTERDETTANNNLEDSWNTSGTEASSMASTHAMAPIEGKNGYQQHVNIDPDQPLVLTVSNASGAIRIVESDQPGVRIVVRRSDGNDEHDAVRWVDRSRIDADFLWPGERAQLAELCREVLDRGPAKSHLRIRF